MDSKRVEHSTTTGRDVRRRGIEFGPTALRVHGRPVSAPAAPALFERRGGATRCVTPRQACPRPEGFGRNLRSKTRWFTGFCNSHQVSHFATFFIDARAEISVAESCFDIQDTHHTPNIALRERRNTGGRAIHFGFPWRIPRRVSLARTPRLVARRRGEGRDGEHAPHTPRPQRSMHVFTVCCAGFDNDPSAGSPTETLLRLLLPLNDKVQWTSRDVAGSEPPTSPRSEHFTGPFNR